MSEFPKWGFWTDYIVGGRVLHADNKAYNTTSTRHLFIAENRTACGYNPAKRALNFIHFAFSAVPKVHGIYEILSEMNRGKLLSAEDFSKCKKCQKWEDKNK